MKAGEQCLNPERNLVRGSTKLYIYPDNWCIKSEEFLHIHAQRKTIPKYSILTQQVCKKAFYGQMIVLCIQSKIRIASIIIHTIYLLLTT